MSMPSHGLSLAFVAWSKGNLGDARGVGAGVMEMRIDYGPGYRVYYAFEE
jgi:putative addiction module killer protein